MRHKSRHTKVLRTAGSALIALLMAVGTVRSVLADAVALTVQTDNVVNTIHPHVYGHFFEHIYHSANGGIWGEAVWNRSFEQNTEGLQGGPGGWYLDGDRVVFDRRQPPPGQGPQDQSRLLGGFEWRDFDYTVEARRTAGEGALQIFFRTKGRNAVMLAIGAEDNAAYVMERIAWRGGRRGGGGGPPTQPASATTPFLSAPGKIENDQWYRVRIRVEGNNVTASINDRQIMSGELPQGTIPQGYIGVGVTAANRGTKAEFRNFRVTGLDGKLYWDRPVPVSQKNSVSEKWSVFGGEGRIIRDDTALNDEAYLRLTHSNGQTIVQQDNFSPKAGDAYEGSLWLKGSAPAGATVQFVQGDNVLAEAKVPAPTGEWKEYPIALTSSTNAQGASLRIVFEGNIDVGIDQVSLMPASAKANGGFDPMMYEAFAGLKPTVLRWPGGCYAEQYKWKHGVGPQHTRKKSLTPWWEDYDPNALGTDEFIALCRKIGADPLMVINTGMHVAPDGTDTLEEWRPWIEEACQWIEYCNGPADSEWGKVRAANGHPEPYNIKLWEIDNELWRSRQRDPATYAEAVRHFAAAMKKVDPSITIIAHGGNGLDRRYNEVVVNNSAESFDILSIHHYTNPQQFATGVGDQDALYKDTIELLARSKNPNIKLYVSEWNAQTTDWRTGLYAGGLLNVFERHGAVLTMGGPALMAREVTAHDWDNAFINFDRNSWFPGPNYVVMKLWHDNFAPSRLNVTGGGESPTGLNLVATKTEDGQEIILKAVNASDQQIDVSATLEGAFRAADGTMQIVAPGSLHARNTFADPNLIKPVDAAVGIEAGSKVTFAMPPHSAGVVRLRAR